MVRGIFFFLLFFMGTKVFPDAVLEKAKKIYKSKLEAEEERHQKICRQLLKNLRISYESAKKRALARGDLDLANKIDSAMEIALESEGESVEEGETASRIDFSIKDELLKNIFVTAEGYSKATPINELQPGKNFYDSWDKKRDVIMVHPFSDKDPSRVDFSRITKGQKGTLTLYFRNSKDNDCLAHILLDGKLFKNLTVEGNKWIKVKIPFKYQSLVVEGHSGGKHPWMYEFLYLAYKFTQK